jgi:hypothetical protein
MPATAKARPPRWYAIPLRVALVTFILTLLSFAVCLFVAILGTVIAGRLHGATPDLRIAYRHIALPFAIVVGCITLVATTVSEIRHYRQMKTLAGIAQASQRRVA